MDNKITLEEAAKAIDDICKIQCSDGNWNYSDYMRGMANGLLLAKSIFDGVNPVYFEPQESYLEDTIDPNYKPIAVCQSDIEHEHENQKLRDESIGKNL